MPLTVSHSSSIDVALGHVTCKACNGVHYVGHKQSSSVSLSMFGRYREKHDVDVKLDRDLTKKKCLESRPDG